MVTVVELDFEEGVGLFVDDDALSGDQVFCCQLVSPLGMYSHCAATITQQIRVFNARQSALLERVQKSS